MPTPETVRPARAAAPARLHVRGRQAGLEQLGERALQLVAPVQLQVALQAGLGGGERVLGRLVLRGRARQQHVGYALAQHERAARVPLLRARARPCCSALNERLCGARDVIRYESAIARHGRAPGRAAGRAGGGRGAAAGGARACSLTASVACGPRTSSSAAAPPAGPAASPSAARSTCGAAQPRVGYTVNRPLARPLLTPAPGVARTSLVSEVQSPARQLPRRACCPGRTPQQCSASVPSGSTAGAASGEPGHCPHRKHAAALEAQMQGCASGGRRGTGARAGSGRACCPVMRHRPPVMTRSERYTRPDSSRRISPSAKATAAWASSCRAPGTGGPSMCVRGARTRVRKPVGWHAGIG